MVTTDDQRQFQHKYWSKFSLHKREIKTVEVQNVSETGGCRERRMYQERYFTL